MSHPGVTDVRSTVEQEEPLAAETLQSLSEAVYSDHAEVVDRLLPISSPRDVYNALLMSIAMGYDHLSEKIIRSSAYSKARLCGNVRENLIDATQDDSQDNMLFTADVTPLILASQKNQFSIVHLLISMGEIIEEPHSNVCQCENCRGSPNYDELQFSHKRLNTFRAVCSEAYILYTSTDPILTAFQRTKQMRVLKVKEINFRAQYGKIMEDLEKFTCDMLQCIRTGYEQEIFLRKGAGRGLKRDKLARIKLAIHFQHKKFVANSNCQEKMAEVWYGQFRFIQNFNIAMYILFCFVCVVAYPFAALAYLIWPCSRKVTEFISNPFIKFLAGVSSYVVFVVLIATFGANESPSAGIRLSGHQVIGPLYENYVAIVTARNESVFIQDIFLRKTDIDVVMIVVTIWIVGMAWQMIRLFINERLEYVFQNPYNMIEVPAVLLYMISFALRYASVFKIQEAINYFSDQTSWNKLANNSSEAELYSYWLDADRHAWSGTDFFYVSQVMFCMANVLTICRLTYVLAFIHHTGPLIVTLGKMMVDVFWFMFLLVVIIFAFVIGLQNILWYYPENVRAQAETGNYPPAFSDPDFGSFLSVLNTLFWSIFGIGDQTVFFIDGYPTEVMQVTAMILFAAYEWLMLIILINILIAMMSDSYQMISDEEDIHWKFYLSLLMLEYLRDDGSVCIPLNIFPLPRAIYDCATKAKRPTCCAKKRDAQNTREDMDEDDEEDEDTPPAAKPLKPVIVRPHNVHKPVMVIIPRSPQENGNGVKNIRENGTSEHFNDSQQPVVGINPMKNSNRNQQQFEIIMQKVVNRFIQRRTRVDDSMNGDKVNNKDADKIKLLATIERNLNKLRRDFTGMRSEFVSYVQSEIHSDDRKRVIHKLTGVDESTSVATSNLLALKRSIDNQIMTLTTVSKQHSDRLSESLSCISDMQNKLLERLMQAESTVGVLEKTLRTLPIKHIGLKDEEKKRPSMPPSLEPQDPMLSQQLQHPHVSIVNYDGSTEENLMPQSNTMETNHRLSRDTREDYNQFSRESFY